MIKEKKLSFTEQTFCIICSWIGAVTLEYLMVPKEYRTLIGLIAISKMSGIRVLCMTTLQFAVWNIAFRSFADLTVGRWLMVGVFALYATSSVINSFSWPFFGACILVMLILVTYAMYGWNHSIPNPVKAQKEKKIWPILTIITTLMFFYMVSAWTVARVRSFNTHTFDFGIFSQMFHYMRTTGRPMTTLERDRFLSHFAVHVSPIYYLMLPFYCLIPRPETLQVLQAAVLAIAILPLWKLGKLHGLHPGLRTAVCVLLLLYPAYAGGTDYNLHENCFLTPLILFLLYGLDSRNAILTGIFTLLTLMVKEDAPVYVAVIGIFVLLRAILHKDKWGCFTGSAVMLLSIAWFFAVTAYLTNNGDGVMNYRYENFMYDGSNSLFTVIKAVLLCPMKAVYECVDSEKLEFIGLTMLPLLGLPLITRRYERYILLIPYFLVNLMSDYRYQHDIWFQYSFGSIACLFYLVIVNLADFKGIRNQTIIAGIALCIGFGCFYELILPRVKQYHTYITEYQDRYELQESLLAAIPDDASVAATTYYTTHLANRFQLYDVRYGSAEHILDCDYVVASESDSGSYKQYEWQEGDGRENFVTMLLENGFRLEERLPGVLEIYKKMEPT